MSGKHLPSGTIWLSVLASLTVVGSAGIAISYFHNSPSAEVLAAGKVLFEHKFTAHDPLCGNGDGLGPVFNADSCVACHFQGGVGGSGPNEFNVTTFEAFPVPGRAEVVAGGVHASATSAEFKESVTLLESQFPPVRGAIRVVNGCAVEPRDFDPLQIEELNTPALFGLAEIEQISSTSIIVHGAKRNVKKVSREMGGDFSGAGFGRIHNDHKNRVGRFGWKGQFATIEDFVANACAMELGLTNPRVSQPKPKQYVPDQDAELDMTKQQLYQLVSFVKSLPRPVQVRPKHPELAAAVEEGEQLFHKVGCADCHVRDIGGVEGVYSDFHLYEVEHEKAIDEYIEPDFDPNFTLPHQHPRPSEWQTPPLWGVADSAPYFHDGQSATLTDAIKRHGRDGAFSRENYQKLDAREKHKVLLFLNSLRAPQLQPCENHTTLVE